MDRNISIESIVKFEKFEKLGYDMWYVSSNEDYMMELEIRNNNKDEPKDLS